MTHSAMHLGQYDQHGRFNITQPAPGVLPTVVVTTDFATVRHKVTAFRVTDGALTATLVSLVSVIWVIAGIFLKLGALLDARRLPLIRAIWAELRPFYLPAIVILLGENIASGHIWGWYLVSNASTVANWFIFKNVDEDDRWKRRGRKVLEKITATDRGLVVVPDSAGAS